MPRMIDIFNMVDMGGIDVVKAQGEKVDGLFLRLLNSIQRCRYSVLCNWLFAEIPIVPTYVELVFDGDEVSINGLITVTSDDIVHVHSIEEPAVIEPLTVSENGTYTPSIGVDGYAPVIVNVTAYAFIVATYQVGAVCTATNGSITLTSPDTSGIAVFTVPTPSSTPETWTITATLGGSFSSVTVSVSSYGARYEVVVPYILPSEYKAVEYLEVGSTAGPYIATGASLSATAFFEIKAKYTGTPSNDTWLFGAWASYKDTILGYFNSKIRFLIGNEGTNVNFDTDMHIYYADNSGVYIDGVQVGNVNWNNVPTNLTYHIFKIDGQNTPTKNARIYSCKIWSEGELIRNFVPCYRMIDDEPGMYDIINNVFYTNSGTGSFILGPEPS